MARILSNKIAPSLFLRYDLSDEEVIEGSKLTNLQKMCIQNQICTLAEEKSELEYSEEDKVRFLQLESYTKGKIHALEYLLQLSETAETPLEINYDENSGE